MPEQSAILDFEGAFFIASENFEKVLKDGTNPHFESKFASLKSVLSAVTGALREQRMSLRQYTVTKEGRQHLHTRLTHLDSGEFIESTWELHPAKIDPQGEGSALTYARRYAILTMMGLVPEDDDGNDASTRNSRERQEAEDEQKRREQERAAEKSREHWIEKLKAATNEAEARAVGNEANTARVLDLDIGGGQTVREAVKKLIEKFTNTGQSGADDQAKQ